MAFMQLTLNTDYSFRVLMYIADNTDRQISTQEISDFYQISKNHLVKVVNQLGHLGYLTLKRGRYGGGITLAKKAEEIHLGQVFREVESTMDLVECFSKEKNSCQISANCRLKGVLFKAQQAFLAELDEFTLKDVVGSSKLLDL